jgi:hypothetical protein
MACPISLILRNERSECLEGRTEAIQAKNADTSQQIETGAICIMEMNTTYTPGSFALRKGLDA